VAATYGCDPIGALVARVRQARRCRAHRADGQLCSAFAILGGTVCVAHGGGSHRVRRAANLRLLVASIDYELAHDQRRLAKRRLDWFVDRVMFAAAALDAVPLAVAQEYRQHGWILLPLGVDWPVGLRLDDEPTMDRLPRDRRFSRRRLHAQETAP
jgi:hypothetical protein